MYDYWDLKKMYEDLKKENQQLKKQKGDVVKVLYQLKGSARWGKAFI